MKKKITAKRMRWTKTNRLTGRDGRRRLSMTLFLSILIPVMTATANGSAPAADRVTLEQCIEIARNNSPELRMASNAIASSRLDRKLAGQARWPQLRLVGDAGYAPVSLDFGYDPAVSNGGELGARIVAEQTLYSGGLVGLEVKQAETQTVLRSLEWQQQHRDLVFAVRQAFIDLLAAERQHDLSDRSVERLTDYAELVTDLNNSGRVGYTDVLNARVELARGQIDSGTAVQMVNSARLNLNRLLGLPDDTVLAVTGSLDSLLLVAADTGAVIPDTVTTDNLEIRAARLGLKQSRLTLDFTRSQWKPTVALTADAGVVTSRENLLLPPSERYRSTGYSVGISIEMPLWDRGKRKTETARSHTEIRSAEDNLVLVSRDVRVDYRNTRLRLIDARRRLIAIREVVQTAEKSYLLNKAQYADGYVTASEVLLAQQVLTDTNRSEIDALAEIQSLKARLDMLTWSEKEVTP
jgi:outer membrane protein